MITIDQFNKAKKEGRTLIYDYGFGTYCEIKPIDIHTIKGNNFWFNAEIVKSTIQNDTSHFYATGSKHSFSNSFITENLEKMKQEAEEYKKTQIAFVKSSFIKGL